MFTAETATEGKQRRKREEKKERKKDSEWGIKTQKEGREGKREQKNMTGRK